MIVPTFSYRLPQQMLTFCYKVNGDIGDKFFKEDFQIRPFSLPVPEQVERAAEWKIIGAESGPWCTTRRDAEHRPQGVGVASEAVEETGSEQTACSGA